METQVACPNAGGQLEGCAQEEHGARDDVRVRQDWVECVSAGKVTNGRDRTRGEVGPVL